MQPPPKPSAGTEPPNNRPLTKGTNNDAVSTPVVSGSNQNAAQETEGDKGGSQNTAAPQWDGWICIENPGKKDPPPPPKRPGEYNVLYQHLKNGKKKWSTFKDETFKTEEDSIREQMERGKRSGSAATARALRSSADLGSGGTPASKRSNSVPSTGPQTRGATRAGSRGANTFQTPTIDEEEEEEEKEEVQDGT